MKELLVHYAAYNFWASKAITDTILEIDEHLHQQIVKSSFPNLYATVLHMWDAESVWWQRVEGHQQVIIPGRQFNPTMKEAVNGLLQQSAQWESKINEATEDFLKSEYDYKNSKGQTFRSAVWQTVHHLLNHGTYHRGQLVTMMRELGVEEIPATDFFHYVRTINQPQK